MVEDMDQEGFPDNFFERNLNHGVRRDTIVRELSIEDQHKNGEIRMNAFKGLCARTILGCWLLSTLLANS